MAKLSEASVPKLKCPVGLGGLSRRYRYFLNRARELDFNIEKALAEILGERGHEVAAVFRELERGGEGCCEEAAVRAADECLDRLAVSMYNSERRAYQQVLEDLEGLKVEQHRTGPRPHAGRLREEFGSARVKRLIHLVNQLEGGCQYEVARIR